MSQNSWIFKTFMHRKKSIYFQETFNQLVFKDLHSAGTFLIPRTLFGVFFPLPGSYCLFHHIHNLIMLFNTTHILVSVYLYLHSLQNTHWRKYISTMFVLKRASHFKQIHFCFHFHKARISTFFQFVIIFNFLLVDLSFLMMYQMTGQSFNDGEITFFLNRDKTIVQKNNKLMCSSYLLCYIMCWTNKQLTSISKTKTKDDWHDKYFKKASITRKKVYTVYLEPV